MVRYLIIKNKLMEYKVYFSTLLEAVKKHIAFAELINCFSADAVCFTDSMA